jgi:hypothetical protein
VDLGETDANPLLLTKFSKKVTLAPRINNEGYIIGNNASGGFIILLDRWFYAPNFQGMTVNFHALNAKGDLLVSLNRENSSVEWMVWPKKECAYGEEKQHIHTIDPFIDRFYLTDMNCEGEVTGFDHQDNIPLPITWKNDQGIQNLGVNGGLDVKGVARSINSDGHVAGIQELLIDQPPFWWNPSYGLETLKNYQKVLEPSTWIEFGDLILLDDDTIYGTYWIRHCSVGERSPRFTTYHAYKWEPRSGLLEKLYLDGMRFTAANNAHVLVGTWREEAALRDSKGNPVKLAALINPSEIKGWVLQEATDINDEGNIVGYGTYQGKVHLFLVKPLR